MTGIDGHDWSPFGGNPAPGDPDVIRAIAAQLRDLADQAAMQSRLLQATGSESHSIWAGPAASAFRPHLEKLPGQLAKLTTSYHDAADALDGYWPRLSAAQQLALEALARYHTAHGQLASANAAASQADASASAASDAYNTAALGLASGPPDPTGAAASRVASLQTAYQTAAAAQHAAHAAVASASAAVAAARSLADQARTQARTAAAAVSSGLHGASHAGIQNPHHSWFSSVVDFVEGVGSDVVHFAEHHWVALIPGVGPLIEAGEWLVKQDPALFKAASAILGTVSLAAGLLAMVPVVGEIALPIAIASAALQTADDVFLAMDHEGSWGAVGWDAFGDVTLGAGDGLVRVGETLGETSRLTADSSRLASEAGSLEAEVAGLGRDAGALRSFDSYTVPLLSADGPARWVKVSDLADETETRLARAESKLAAVQKSSADTEEELRGLSDVGSLGAKLRYAMPTDGGGALSRTTQFFRSPAQYVRQALDTGDLTFKQAVGESFGDQWASPGRLFTAGSYAVGGAAMYTGSTADAGAYHDWLHPDHAGAGRAGG